MISVIIPAHDEERGIARLLQALGDGKGDRNGDGNGDLDVIVVCNGCRDRTAEVARGFPGVRVLESPIPSKWQALRLGDEVALGFPRAYVDADVEIGAAGLRALAAALQEPGVLVSAPDRVVPREGVALPVRWYYDVWERLPQVRSGVFGRGVIAVSADGFARIADLPSVTADDLAVSAAFAGHERRIVPGARVMVHPPRTWADLLRRRTRAVSGTAQVYADPEPQSAREPRTDSRTSRADLLSILRADPRLAVKLPVFLAVALLGRRRAAAAARRGDTTWLRDESSRSG